MIELIRGMFREAFSMIKENALAFCLALVSGLLVLTIYGIILLFLRLEIAKDKIEALKDREIGQSYVLSLEKEALRKSNQELRDSIYQLQNEFNLHLRYDLKEIDSPSH